MSFNEADYIFEFSHTQVDTYGRRYTECRAYNRADFNAWLDHVRSTHKGSIDRRKILEQRPASIVTGVATCRPGDNFCKATGRAKSKGRAIQQLKYMLEYAF